MIEFYGGYQVYSESGVDLTLLRENLKRPVEARLEANRRFQKLIGELQEPNPVREQSSVASQERVMIDPTPILRQLHQRGVEYVLIGGLAMIAHGSAYVTNDLDVCYERSKASVAKLAAAMAPLHPYLRGAPPGLPFRFDAPTIQAGLNFTLTTDYGDVDFLGEVRGIGFYPAVFQQSIPKMMFGMEVRVLSLDGLIASKKAAGRTKDRLHLLELEELKKLLDANP